MAALSSDCKAGSFHRRCISRIFGALLEPCECFCHTAIEAEVIEGPELKVEEPGPATRWIDLTAYMTGMKSDLAAETALFLEDRKPMETLHPWAEQFTLSHDATATHLHCTRCGDISTWPDDWNQNLTVAELIQEAHDHWHECPNRG